MVNASASCPPKREGNCYNCGWELATCEGAGKLTTSKDEALASDIRQDARTTYLKNGPLPLCQGTEA